jgi:hypothetical protein
MSKALIALFVCVALPFDLASAHAQVSALPPDIQQKLAAAGPKWQGSLDDTQPMYALFQPLLKAAPKDGVKITKNLAYGSDPKQVLDVYQTSGETAVPILIFIHGGAYVRGSKDDGEMYGNITTWFARQGMLGINADYPTRARGHVALWRSKCRQNRGLGKGQCYEIRRRPKPHFLDRSLGWSHSRSLIHLRQKSPAYKWAERSGHGLDQRPLSS